MKDIVRIFQEYAEAKGIIYTYGNIANLNLKISEGSPEIDDKIYMLVEPTTRKFLFSNTGGSAMNTGVTFTGAFTILKTSDMDMPYFTEMENDENDSKYVKNIEPLLGFVKDLADSLSCLDMDIEAFDCIDAVDFLDENRDGILVRYQLKLIF